MEQGIAKGVKRERPVSPVGHVWEQLAFRPKKVKLGAENEDEGADVQYGTTSEVTLTSGPATLQEFSPEEIINDGSVASQLDQIELESGSIDNDYLLYSQLFPFGISPWGSSCHSPSSNLPPLLQPPIWFSPPRSVGDELSEAEPEKRIHHNQPIRRRRLPLSVDLEPLDIPNEFKSFAVSYSDQPSLTSDTDIAYFSSTSSQYLPYFHEQYPPSTMGPGSGNVLDQFSNPNEYVVTRNLNPPGPVTGSIIPLRSRTNSKTQQQASGVGQTSHARTQSVPSTQGYGGMRSGYGHHTTLSLPAAVASPDLQNAQIFRAPQMQMPPRSSASQHRVASSVRPLMLNTAARYRQLDLQSALAEPPSPLDNSWSHQLSALPQTFAPPNQRVNRAQNVATPQVPSPLASPTQGVVKHNDLRGSVTPDNGSGRSRPVGRSYNTPPLTATKDVRQPLGVAAQLQGFDWIAADLEARQYARWTSRGSSISNPVDLTSPTLETRSNTRAVQKYSPEAPIETPAVNRRQPAVRQTVKPVSVPSVEPLDLSDKEKDFIFFLHLHDVDAAMIRDQFTYKPFKRFGIKTEQIKQFMEVDPHLQYPRSSVDDLNNTVRECAQRLVNNGRRGRWHYNVNSAKTGRRMTKDHHNWLREAKGELVGEWNDPELQETEERKEYWRKKTFEDHDWQNERVMLEKKLKDLWKGKDGQR